MPRLDLTGRVFGRLTVEYHSATRPNGHIVWMCRCICGNQHETAANNLTSGHVSSCGCLRREIGRTKNLKHGAKHRHPSEYAIWMNMRQRCNNPRSRFYADYGGRGITVCERWGDFAAFLADMGERPDGKTLDRIDNDRGYEPTNCRWATTVEQARNKRDTLNETARQLVRYMRRRGATLADLAHAFGIGTNSIRVIAAGIRGNDSFHPHYKGKPTYGPLLMAADESEGK